VVLGATAILVHAAPWSKIMALVVTAALTSLVEIVLSFAAWHRDPARRLLALARLLERRGVRVVVEDAPEEEAAIRLRARRLLEGVRSVVVACRGTDLVMLIALSRHASGVPRALGTLPAYSSRRVEDGALVVSVPLPRFLAASAVMMVLDTLGERRKPREAPFSGQERRRTGVPSAVAATT